jgi:hypothetical protein
MFDNETSDGVGACRAAHLITVFVLGLISVIESGSACEQASGSPAAIASANRASALVMKASIRVKQIWPKFVKNESGKLSANRAVPDKARPSRSPQRQRVEDDRSVPDRVNNANGHR